MYYTIKYNSVVNAALDYARAEDLLPADSGQHRSKHTPFRHHITSHHIAIILKHFFLMLDFFISLTYWWSGQPKGNKYDISDELYRIQK